MRFIPAPALALAAAVPLVAAQAVDRPARVEARATATIRSAVTIGGAQPSPRPTEATDRLRACDGSTVARACRMLIRDMP